MPSFRRCFVVAVFCLVWIAPEIGHGQHADITGLQARADSLYAVSDWDAAKDVYKQILKTEANSLVAHMGLGKIAAAQEKWGDAADEFGEVLDREVDNTEAHYYRGIARRENGKFKAFILRSLEWNKAEKDFRAVLAQDSSFQDVLYQYALLQRYRENYTDAILLGQAQVRRRPELLAPQVGLFRLYKFFIEHEKTAKVLAWLDEHPDEHAQFARGEAWRHDNKLDQASAIFDSLLTRDLHMSRQPILLALARIAAKQEHPEKTATYFRRAVDGIATALDAELVFEDLKYVLTDQEYQDYRGLSTSQAKRDFFKTMWTRRDPTPAADYNVRLAEHYRRLLFAEENYTYDGFKTWFNNPDKFSYLHFPRVYTLNEEFNDKGLVYIRHGRADEWAVTVGENVPTNESWLYWRTEDTPELQFHFLYDKEATGNLWRLSPIITNAEMLADRVGWGSIYYRLLNARPTEQLAYEDEMAQQSQKSVAIGFVTDRHTWDKKTKLLTMPYATATFRGDNGKTVLEFYYGLPVYEMAKSLPDSATGIALENGLALLDTQWHPVEKLRRQTRIPVNRKKLGKKDMFIDLFRVAAAADSYYVSAHAQPEHTDLLAGYDHLPITLPNYDQPGLNLSDIVLATNITAAVGRTRFVRGGLQVVPNPTSSFAIKSPVFVYFEVYGLSVQDDGKTEFSIEYTLRRQKGQRGGIARLFGGDDKQAISARFDREGNTPTSVEYLAIDVNKAKKGEHELVVTVVDKPTQTRSSKSVQLNFY